MYIRFEYRDKRYRTFQVTAIHQVDDLTLTAYRTTRGKLVLINSKFWARHSNVLSVQADYFFKGVQNPRADRPERKRTKLKSV